ncbi:MAG TPA: AAA family ATPase [Ktedonobacteraceae bacterium]|nr:AAA family ATPase [Ktedonobacteraceae bacterium]
MHSNNITYRQQYSFCSKAGCRKCREGIGHGPYWYAYQTVQGRTVRTYIGKTLPEGVPEAQIATPAPVAVLEPAGSLAPVFRLTTLGTLRLESRGEGESWQVCHETGWRLPQARALLGALVSAPGRQMTPQQASERIWPELDKKNAAQQLRRASTALSQLLGSVYSKQSDALFSLAGQAQFWVDSTAFEDLLTLAHASPGERRAERMALLEQAVKLYGGDFFPEEHAARWPVEYRQRLREQWSAAMLDLVDFHLDEQRTTAASELLNQVLAANPMNEAAVQRLMFLLALQQRRVEAVQAYQRLTTLLQHAHQAAPSPETRALFQSIQQGHETLFKPFATTASGQGEAGSSGEEAAMRWQSLHGSHQERLAASNDGASQQLDETEASEQMAATISFVRAKQSPLVGREAEMRILGHILEQVESMRARQSPAYSAQVLFQEARRTPRAHCLVMMGEAGIGKTRLAEETARDAQRRGWSVVWSRAYEQERGIPYRLWTAALRGVLTHAPDVARQATEFTSTAIYQPLRNLVPEIQDVLDVEGKMSAEAALYDSLSPEQEELRLREAFYTFLTTLSFNSPLLIVLDDVHWADDSSSQMLGYLTRRMTDHPIVILATCRETELAAHRILSGLIAHMQREQVIELVHIQPLSDEHIGALEQVSGLPSPVITQIQNQAAGNPFFAEELAYWLRASGADMYSPAHGNVETLVLPDSIAAALNQRLKRLSKTCRDLLDKAAVLGGSFDLKLITATESGGAASDEDVVLDLLEEALQSGVLTEEGAGANPTYHFWHPLLASHLYNSLSFTRRARLHQRIANVLRQIHQTRESEEAATITQHLIRGGGDPMRIAHYAELAAHHAYSLFAYFDAERYYRLVLERLAPRLLLPAYPGQPENSPLPDIPPEQRMHLAFLIERLAECARILGNFQDAPSFYLRAIQLRTTPPRVFASPAEERQEAQIQAILWSEIALIWRFVGDTAAARADNARGSEILRASGITDGPAWGCLLHQQASLYWHEGDHQTALQASLRALDIFTACLQEATNQNITPASRQTRALRTLQGDPVDLGRVHGFLGIAYTAMGQLSEALKHLREAIAIYQQNERRREVAHTCCNIGHVYLLKADYQQARDCFLEPMSYVEQSGDTPLRSVVLYNMGELAAATGRLEEAERFYREGLALAAQIKDREYLSTWSSILGMVLIRQRRFKDAAEVILQALSIGRAEPPNQPCIGFALAALANLRSALVENERAERTPAGRRALLHARKHLQRALDLGELDAERRTMAQLFQARVSYMLGELPLARLQCEQARQAAHAYELQAIEGLSQELQTVLSSA